MTNPLEIDIPQLSLVIPEPVIDWAFEQYSSLLLDVVELELESVPSELDSLWTAWGSLHDRIWGSGFDLVSAMGYVNVLASEKSKELVYGRNLYLSQKGVFAESIRTKNLRLYLSARLEIEKQRQARHVTEQGMRMEYAKGMIEASIEAYNVAVKEFNANVSALELEAKRWQAVVAVNEQELKLLELQYMEARLESEYVKGDIRRQRALAAKLAAEADVQRLLAEIELNAARVQAAEIEVQRLALQALLVGTQAIEVQAQTLSLQVDADVIRAEGEVLQVLDAENSRLDAEIVNVETIRDARDAMYEQILADKQELMVLLAAAEDALRTATLELSDAQIELNSMQIDLDKTKDSSGDLVEDAEDEARKTVEDATFDAQIKVEDARFDADGVIEDAQFAAESKLLKAQADHDKKVLKAKFDSDAKIDDAEYEHDKTISDAQFSHDMKISDKEFDVETAIEGAQYGYDKAVSQAQFDAEMKVAKAQDDYDDAAREAAFDIEMKVMDVDQAKTDDSNNRQAAIAAGEGYLKENKGKAAALLKNAKVYNSFTEYRQQQQ